MRMDLVRAVLDCGNDDLDLLDDAGADIYKMVQRMREKGLDISLHSIIGEVFREGIFRFCEAVESQRKALESQEKSGEITEAEYERLRKLKDYRINPEEDFEFYLNFQDTHLFAPADKQVVYEELFERELHDLEGYTGFDIEW